jgi:hypothetical protein
MSQEIDIEDKGFIANTAAVVFETLNSPLSQSLLIFVTPQGPPPGSAGVPGSGGPPGSAGPPGSRAPPPPKTVTLNPVFKLIFLTVFIITLLAGLAEIIMAIEWEPMTNHQQTVFDAMDSTWKAGVGVIFGLIGGKLPNRVARAEVRGASDHPTPGPSVTSRLCETWLAADARNFRIGTSQKI